MIQSGQADTETGLFQLRRTGQKASMFNAGTLEESYPVFSGGYDHYLFCDPDIGLGLDRAVVDVALASADPTSELRKLVVSSPKYSPTWVKAFNAWAIAYNHSLEYLAELKAVTGQEFSAIDAFTANGIEDNFYLRKALAIVAAAAPTEPSATTEAPAAAEAAAVPA